MTLNRLIEPSSELAMSDWVARSALSDILKEDFRRLNEDRLYRKLWTAPWPTGPNLGQPLWPASRWHPGRERDQPPAIPRDTAF
jgi:hypothetical protein